MKHLKLYESFNGRNIRKICKQYGIENYTTINKDGSIDVNGDVYLKKYILSDNKLPLKFNKVSGYFDCSSNKLTTLENSPKIVGDFFSCADNQLTSLEGGPKIVNGDFYCSNNNLTSLKGCPEFVDGDFLCNSNYQLKTFEYFPKHISNSFACNGCPIYSIWELFHDTSKIELFNDMDIIQDEVLILDRLNYFLEEIGKPTVKSIRGYKYI